MVNFIEQFYEETFGHISHHYPEDLVSAKKKYFEIVKTVPDENDNLYETKMILFNEWFLFNYREKYDSTESFFNKITRDKTFNFFSPDQIQSIQAQYYSLFEYIKKKRNGYLFYDWQKKEKFLVPLDFSTLGLMRGDLFIARRVTIADEYWFLKGQSILPSDSKKAILKQLKMIQKGKVDMTIEEFLMELEILKFRTQIYPHIAPKDIFKFK